MSSNPRRTPVTRLESRGLALKTNMVLRKGATFHSPTTPPASPETTFRPPALPRRSQTSLDDVSDAYRRRAAMTCGNIDKILSGSRENSAEPTSSKPLRDNSLPIPRGVLTHTLDTIMGKEPEAERRVLRPRTRRTTRHHESDSGLGTSIATHTEKGMALKKEASMKTTAVTRSAAARSTTSDKVSGLSARATTRIYEHTLQPLLAEPSFKDFHPLVLECPKKIQDKDIVCLRDLEKTLLLVAPVSEVAVEEGVRGDTYRALFLKERTKAAGLYLDFCLTTIRCIQATVEFLSESEQTQLRDLPYTGGYFIDLVDQIRRYAQQLADAKENGASTEMDVDPYAFPVPAGCIAPFNMHIRTDQIKLHGGINVNGRPAELVRIKKDGKTIISLATGQLIESIETEPKNMDTIDPVRIKRSASEGLEDEEDILRSMARRKKNATPEELAPKKCREVGCTKEFKRPCDLTKHEKTHSRPWKCPVPTCKYHEYGWPTEKEMDRHHNDKHSAAPPMYECQFKPCPYKSKRESNCKQHMEKAHGWTYVRTKTNGKKGSSVPSIAGHSTHPTPMLQHLPTPPSDQSIGVATPPDEWNYGRNMDFPAYLPTDDFNMMPQEISLDYSPEYSPIDGNSPFTDASMDHNTAYQDIATNMFEDIYGATAHLPASVHANIYNKDLQQQFVPFTTAELGPPQQAHLSPIGQGNAMLFTPTSQVDEGFDDRDFAALSHGNHAGDFILFPGGVSKPMFNDASLFATEIPSMAAGYSQPSSQEFLAGYNMDWQYLPQ